MTKVQLYTKSAQLDLEGKVLELPESPLIGDHIFFENLFNEDELDRALYESGKNCVKLEGKVISRMWFLEVESLDYHLLLEIELIEK